MSEYSTNVPKMRFPGFTDAWEQHELDDIVNFYSGLTYSPDNVIKNGGTLVLRSSNVKDGEIVSADDVHVQSAAVNSNNVRVGDVIVVVRNGSRSLIGKHAQIKQPMDNTVIGAFMTGVRSEIPEFTNALLDTKQFDLEINKNLGATINQITTGAFKKMRFYVPKKDEEQKIGQFFVQFDHLINLHQRKLNHLRDEKKSLLQKMFPKNGADIPEIRFPGFTHAWEQRKLGEVADFFDEKRVPIDSTLRTSGEYPYYGATGVIDYVHDYIFDGEYVLLAEDGANIIMRNSPLAYLTQGKFWLNNHAHIMRMKDGDNSFLLQLLEKQDYVKYNTGTAQPKLNGEMVKKMILTFPSCEEQTKIGHFFSQLDHLITLHQSKLNHLQEQKKSLLQQMFV